MCEPNSNMSASEKPHNHIPMQVWREWPGRQDMAPNSLGSGGSQNWRPLHPWSSTGTRAALPLYFLTLSLSLGLRLTLSFHFLPIFRSR